MKKIFVILLFNLFILFSVVSCSKVEYYNQKNYLTLCDYKNIEIDSDYLELTSDEINMIISMDFSSNDYYKLTDKKTVELNDIILIDIFSENPNLSYNNIYYEIGSFELSTDFDNQLVGKSVNSKRIYKIIFDDTTAEIEVTIKGVYKLADANSTTDILEFYGYDSLEETISFIKKRASKEILYNYMLEYLLQNSTINYFPSEIENKITKRLNELNNSATLCQQSLDEYLAQYNTNVESIKNDIYNFYYELLLYEAILKNENIYITNNDMKQKKKQMALENAIDEKNIYDYFTEEDLYFEVLSDKVKDVLLSFAIIKK